jgi:hypothetical protein
LGILLQTPVRRLQVWSEVQIKKKTRQKEKQATDSCHGTNSNVFVLETHGPVSPAVAGVSVVECDTVWNLWQESHKQTYRLWRKTRYAQ